MLRQFDVPAIEGSLVAFREAFPAINDRLAIRREELTPVMVANIAEAYRYLNTLLAKGMDLFTPAGLHGLLELNHIVLCGTDRETRTQYYAHLEETRRSFLRQIRPIKDWVLRKRTGNDPYHLATGFYSRMLSRPQLFLEGNHRTGNIILNYLLVSRNSAPYVVSTTTAHTYLDISGDIKFTDNGNYLDTALRMPGHRSRFRAFLRDEVNDAFLESEVR
jgi:hypothetical protein